MVVCDEHIIYQSLHALLSFGLSHNKKKNLKGDIVCMIKYVNSDTSYITGRCPDRKCLCAYVQPEVAQPFLAFFSDSSSSTMDTESHPKGVLNWRLCTLHR